ncbi:hypothetical protein Y032_0016g3015 [Ancylostoma ceylanicum]|uniref:Transmembrane protein n=1 Tax=Ancylostoma ceylanicum TaxID=53326 RepID=A0A016V5G6_9BILA|nr:hypothetical protein Y032_0016g3015 [Ancylostoma ceylanicum]
MFVAAPRHGNSRWLPTFKALLPAQLKELCFLFAFVIVVVFVVSCCSRVVTAKLGGRPSLLPLHCDATSVKRRLRLNTPSALAGCTAHIFGRFPLSPSAKEKRKRAT